MEHTGSQTEQTDINTCIFPIYRRYAILQNAQNASTASHVTEQLPLWHHVATAEKSMYKWSFAN